MNPLLETAYWPNLHYFYYLLNYPEPLIEQFDSYHKQSFRNRCQILTANGKLDLSIPVKKNAGRGITKEVELSYVENWQIKHWRAISSAYGNSPYFEFFEAEIYPFYTTRFQFLVDYNTSQLKLIFKLLKIKKEIALSIKFEKQPELFADLRTRIHPKKDFKEDPSVQELLQTPYYQTFENKFPFHPNLSILDLLFNKGLEAKGYLMRT